MLESDFKNNSSNGCIDMPFVYNPVGFDPTIFLPDKLARYSDDARYFVHKIYEQNVFNKRDKNNFVPLKAEYMRKIISFRKYKSIRDHLLDSGIVETDSHYVINRKATGYRLSKHWRGKRHHRVQITNSRLAKNLNRDKQELHKKIQCRVHAHLLGMLKEVEIDYQQALMSIDCEENFTIYEISIDMIKNKEWFFKWDDFGRVHTNITNLKSTFRKFLRHDGLSLVELDIANSQPFFFGCLIKNYLYNSKSLTTLNYPNSSLLLPSPPSLRCDILHNINIPKDINLYFELVQSGELYQYLEKHFGTKGFTTSELKVKLFAEIFFCKNNWKSKRADRFSELFPNVMQVIRDLKAKDYTALSKLLQKIESAAIINGISRRCMEDYPDLFMTTIHDSVLCKQGDVEKVQQIALDVFREFDMIPTIRIKK